MKVSAEVETFRPSTLVGYASLCGWALARAHAKAGDAAMIAGYLGSSDQFDTAWLNTLRPTLTRRNVTLRLFRRHSFRAPVDEPAKGAGLEFLL